MALRRLCVSLLNYMVPAPALPKGKYRDTELRRNHSSLIRLDKYKVLLRVEQHKFNVDDYRTQKSKRRDTYVGYLITLMFQNDP